MRNTRKFGRIDFSQFETPEVQPLTIAVLGDDPALLRAWEEALASEHVRVVTAKAGSDADPQLHGAYASLDAAAAAHRLDGIVVAATPARRLELARRAIRFGRPVLTERPAGASWQTLADLANQAETGASLSFAEPQRAALQGLVEAQRSFGERLHLSVTWRTADENEERLNRLAQEIAVLVLRFCDYREISRVRVHVLDALRVIQFEHPRIRVAVDLEPGAASGLKDQITLNLVGADDAIRASVPPPGASPSDVARYEAVHTSLRGTDPLGARLLGVSDPHFARVDEAGRWLGAVRGGEADAGQSARAAVQVIALAEAMLAAQRVDLAVTPRSDAAFDDL